MTTAVLPPDFDQESVDAIAAGLPHPGAFYVTFGQKYRDDPNPAWFGAHPDGFLVVLYTPAEVGWEPTEGDASGAPLSDPRERARRALWAWLGGLYAFDYDSITPDVYALGVLGVLDLRA